MAEKAKRINKKVALEPMPAFERKIIHSVLQSRDDVSTYSDGVEPQDRKSTRLNSSHVSISYAVFCLKKKTQTHAGNELNRGLRRVPIAQGLQTHAGSRT